MVDQIATVDFLEAIPTAVLLLDDSAHVLFANQQARALLRRKDAVVLDSGGVLRCCNRTAQRKLQGLLSEVLRTGITGPKALPAALGIPREEGRPLVGFLVCEPAERLSGAGFGTVSRRRIVLLVRDPDQAYSSARTWLVQLYGLSQAEADVADRLAGGASVNEVAWDRGASVATVRNQVKAALAKVGVSRQAELVSLVLRATHF